MFGDTLSPGVSLLCSHLGNRAIFILDDSRYLNRDVRAISVTNQSHSVPLDTLPATWSGYTYAKRVGPHQETRFQSSWGSFYHSI